MEIYQKIKDQMVLADIARISDEDVVYDRNGNEVMLYRLNGVLGLILDEDHMANVRPLEIDGCGNGFYGIEEVPEEHNGDFMAFPDDYAGYNGVGDIVSGRIVNPENKQTLISRFVCKDYYISDWAERELLVDTDNYYEWTSARTRMKDTLYEVLFDDGHTLDSAEHFIRSKELEERWSELWEEHQGHVLDENPDDEFAKMVEEILNR